MPFPYAIPGIGEGIFVVGATNNVFGTSTDLMAMGFTGDAEGYAVTVNELFLIPGFLYLYANQGVAARFGQNVYSSRGMESEKEDFNILVGEDFSFQSYKATITLFERRVELTYGVSDNAGQITEIRDFEGELIQDLTDPIKVESSLTNFQLKIDITDDFVDPRSGINFRSVKDHFPAENEGDPEYDTITNAVTLYIPVLKDSTFLFHYLRSDAVVIKEGNTDLDSLKVENGFSECGGLAACESAVTATAQNQLNANKNGTAKGLGSSDRLRSYPYNRYQSAHAEMFGAEFRWNVNTSGGKFDSFFLKDIMDSFQVAIFTEQGSVAEEASDLGEITRSSYGAGVRFIGQSGSVYRLEVASGDEGVEMVAFFEYPWTGFMD